MLRFSTILFFCFTQTVLLAQSRVTGRIVDAEDKSPIPFATVAVYSITDTALIDGTLASDSGIFVLEKIPRGQYMLRVSFVGYMTFFKVFEVVSERRPVNLGTIELAKGITLNETEIIADIIPILFKGDTIEYNAAAFRPIEGSMLEELLKRLPGAEVDRDGNIKINGKPISQILVDGEKFFTDNPQIAAQNIPADFVQKVQVFEKKSEEAEFTGIDDGNETTVINLLFKPEYSKGWFGRLSAGVGADMQSGDFRHKSQFNLNYFRGKDQLTIFTKFNNVSDASSDVWFQDEGEVYAYGGRHVRSGVSWRSVPAEGLTQSITPAINLNKKINTKLSLNATYSGFYSDRDYMQNTLRENILTDGSQFFDQKDTTHSITNQHRFNAEIRYDPNEKNQLFIRPRVSYNGGSSTSSSVFKTFSDTLINQGTRQRTSKNTGVSTSLSIDYRRRFAKPQRTISVGVSGSYSTRESTSYNYSHNDFISRIDTIDQKIASNNHSYNWNANASYTEPLPMDFILNFRYNISSGVSNVENLYFNYNPNDNAYNQEDTTHTNIYGNSSFSQSFEVSIQKSKEKYNYSIGLSLRPSYTLNFMEGRGDDVEQNVLNFAPRADFRYRFSQRSSINFRYSGRTEQPSTWQLVATPTNADPLNSRIGNPDLKPAFYHHLTADFNKGFENHSSVSTFVSLNMTQNQISTISIHNPDLFPNITFDSMAYLPGARVIMSDNIDFVYSGNAYIAYGTPIVTQKFRVSTSTDFSLRNSKNIVDKDVNVLNDLALNQNLSISYRAERFDVSLGGSIGGNSLRYSLQPERNHLLYTRSYVAIFAWQIIKEKLTLSSDINFEKTVGYTDGFNPQQTLWNAQLRWSVGKAKRGQLQFEIVDILTNRNDIERRAWENTIQDQKTNILKRYFLVSFTYNLNPAKRTEMQEARMVP